MSALLSSLSPLRLSRNIDQLGALNAQIAVLVKQADAIKQQLKGIGEGEYLGKSFKAVVSERQSVRLDGAKVKAALTPAQLAACAVSSTSMAVSLYDL